MLIKTYAMDARTPKALITNHNTIKIFIDGRILKDRGLYNAVSGMGDAVLGARRFDFQQDIGVYKPVPELGVWDEDTNTERTVGFKADPLASGSFPDLFTASTNAVLAICVFRYKGVSDGHSKGYYGKCTLSNISPVDAIAMSNQGSWHTNIQNTTSYLQGSGAEVVLVPDVDYAMSVEFQSGAGGIYISTITRVSDGTVMSQLTTLDGTSIDIGTLLTLGDTWFEDVAIYGYSLYEFNGNFPSNLSAGMEWHRKGYVKNEIAPYPLWAAL